MTAMIENRKQKERELIFKVEEYFPSIEVDEKIVQQQKQEIQEKEKLLNKD